MADTTYKSTFSMEQISQAIDYTNNQVAEIFSTTGTYIYGDYVMHNDLLYRCIATTAQHGAWVPKNWVVYTRLFNNNEGSNILIVDGGKSIPNTTQSGQTVSTGATAKSAFSSDVLEIE